MDELQLISDALPEERAASQATITAARDRMLDHSGRRTSSPGRGRVARWWPAGVGLTAAAAIAAVAIVQPWQSSRRGTDHTSARGVFLSAAQHTKQQEKTARYWVLTTTSHTLYRVGPKSNRYTMDLKSADVYWYAGHGGDPSRWISPPHTLAPLTTADRDAWRRDGSPHHWPHSLLGHLIRHGHNTRPEVVNIGGDTKVFAIDGEHSVTLRQLRAFPADPAGLRAKLVRYYQSWQGSDAAALSDGPTDEASYLYSALTRVLGSPATTDVRAAAYRVLGTVPGVRSEGKVHDGLGRAGTAVGRVETVDGERIDNRLIIDRDCGRLLDDQQVLRKPTHKLPWAKAGTVLSRTSYQQRWTNKAAPKVYHLPG